MTVGDIDITTRKTTFGVNNDTVKFYPDGRIKVNGKETQSLTEALSMLCSIVDQCTGKKWNWSTVKMQNYGCVCGAIKANSSHALWCPAHFNYKKNP